MMRGARDLFDITGAVTAPRRRHRQLRLLWHRHGPTLLIAAAAGMLLGSYAALLYREFGL